MKKIKIFLTTLFICLWLIPNCEIYAYSNEYYSIQIPSSYTQVSENSFTNEEGWNINIQIVPYTSSKKGKLYTEENLNEIVDEYFKEMDDYRDLLENMLKEKNQKYQSDLTEEEINEYVNSFKIDFMTEKEITTFSKNNYKCFHITSHCSMGEVGYYTDQYTLLSGDDIFTLSISVSELNYLQESEIQKVIDSFTIKNFTEYKEESVWEKVLVTMLSVIIISGISALFNRKKNNTYVDKPIIECMENEKVKVDATNKMSLSDPEEVVIRDRSNGWNVYSEDVRIHKDTDKKYCANCGKTIEENWAYCNYCGHKLKE